jgi:hypothetical protein
MNDAVMERVRAAFDGSDVGLFASVLHPGVRWLAPDLDPRHGCHGADEVLAVVDRAYRSGVRTEVLDARAAGTRILLATRLLAPPRPEREPLMADGETTWRLLTVEAGRVVHIQDCLDRGEGERLLAG